MRKPGSTLLILVMFAAIIAGCARKTTTRPAPAPVVGNSYVAPQSAPVLPPSYPSLAGEVVQPATASIPIVQGK